jgi:hypothetical protein
VSMSRLIGDHPDILPWVVALFTVLELIKPSQRLSVVVHACNSSTPETEQDICEFKVILGYIVTSYLKKHQYQQKKSPLS